MTRLFGTDGIRAPFETPPLDRPTVTAVARALAEALREARGDGGGEPVVVVGGDTRASTPEISRWVAAGLAAGGARTRFVGVMTTPGIAWLTQHLGADAGVAVSASHNPLPDNGVKLLDPTGSKWSEQAERALEDRIAAAGEVPEPPPGPEVQPDGEAAALYLDAVARRVPPAPAGGPPLAGLRVAVDAAHGAASPFARPLFERLGAEVVVLSDQPDGTNINQGCGSTHPERLAETVRREGCDLGIAFDGDADRAVLVDETGTVRDGDAILYLWARRLHRDGDLEPPRIVATSMSNLGLEKALGAAGIDIERCGVGDREVVETMRASGLLLGGEQSGHVVHLGLSNTGDGLLTGLSLAALVAAEGRPLSELLAGFTRYPQVLLNTRVADKPDLDGLPAVRAAKERVERELAGDGRLVLRYSGTEPMARVMIEGPDQERIERLARELVAAIDEEIGE